MEIQEDTRGHKRARWLRMSGRSECSKIVRWFVGSLLSVCKQLVDMCICSSSCFSLLVVVVIVGIVCTVTILYRVSRIPCVG
jgi:hypothetical protein